MHLLRDIAHLLLASACIGCEEPGPPLCELCTTGLMPEPFIVPDLPPALPTTTAGLPYRGLARQAVIAHKEHNMRALTPALGLLLASAVRHLDRTTTLVPVPSHPRSLRARGRDTTNELAQEAGRRLGVPVAPMLARARGDRQKQRTAAQRRQGDGRAGVQLRHGSSGARPRSVILIDDVIATGGTAALCCEVLLVAGIEVIGIATATASLLQHGSAIAMHTQLG